MIVFLFEISPTKRSIYEENISKTSAQKSVFFRKTLKLKKEHFIIFREI
jgi:hypothetical protein